MRVIKASEGGRMTIARAKRRVAEVARASAAKSVDKNLLLLAAKAGESLWLHDRRAREDRRNVGKCGRRLGSTLVTDCTWNAGCGA